MGGIMECWKNGNYIIPLFQHSCNYKEQTLDFGECLFQIFFNIFDVFNAYR